MAPNGWLDRLNNVANRVSDQLQGSSGYKFEVTLGRSEPALAPWMIAAIALAALAVLVCLVVACCRCCCCRSERGRVLIVPQSVEPQRQVVTQYMPVHYPVSPTSMMMQQPDAAATHGAGAYSDNAKSLRSPPPAYDQEALVQLSDTHKYPLLN